VRRGEGASKAPPRSTLFNSSVEKCLEILEKFDLGHGELGLTQIAEITGFDKSTTQRFTYTLVALGYLLKNPVTRRYSLSPRILRLGSSYLRGNPLIERATPYLLDCNRQVGETVNLGVLYEDEVILVARYRGPQVVRREVVVGSSFPWHVSSLGQAIVAQLPDDEIAEKIARVEFVQYAAHTIVNAAALRKRIAEIQKNGFAISYQEIYDGDVSIAAPVFDQAGRVSASVSIAVLASNWTVDDVRARFAPMVMELANTVSGVTHPRRLRA
jgi:DNA-binding IclR family transcriptional regulator